MNWIDYSFSVSEDCQFDEVVIIAPGPSLTKEQTDAVFNSGKFCIVIGNAWRLAPYADILYHCDKQWWDYHKGVPGFCGDLKLSLEHTEFPDVQKIGMSAKMEGLDAAPYVVTGSNSGFQALNLAYHFKPKKIILLGFDMKDRPDGTHNIDGDHPKEIRRGCSFDLFKRHFKIASEILEEEGIKVYNCTTDSALDCFEKAELLSVL